MNEAIANKTDNQLLAFEHVDLGYGKTVIVRDLNLALNAGDFLGIVGPNGAGKTTILKAMLGILRPKSGTVSRKAGVRFGYVPQRQFIDEVFPLNVFDIVLMGRYTLMGLLGRPTKQDGDRVLESLANVGIADLAYRPYRDLSGGQKQRTLIARALAAEPHAMILDEPTNDMDIGSEHAIMELINDLRSSRGITVVMVSHLLNVVVNYAEKLALIDDGVRMVGATDEVLTKENLTRAYGIPVSVALYDDRRIVLTGGQDD